MNFEQWLHESKKDFAEISYIKSCLSLNAHRWTPEQRAWGKERVVEMERSKGLVPSYHVPERTFFQKVRTAAVRTTEVFKSVFNTPKESEEDDE